MAARKTKPPSHEFAAEPYYILAIAEAEKVSGNSAEFQVRAVLFGEAKDEQRVTLAFDDQTAATLGEGVSYIIGYTRFAKAKFPNPEGVTEIPPKLLRSLAAGEAICQASPQAVEILTGATEKKYHEDSEAHLEELLRAIGRDPRLSRMAATEILARPQLARNWSLEQQKRIQRVIEDVNFDPATRSLLLELGRAGALTPEQNATSAATLLRETPIAVLAGDMYWPDLVRSAILTLDKSESGGEPAVFERWLVAPHAGVVSSALGALQSLQPERELTIIHVALREPFLDRSAREVLRQRLKSLSKS